MVARLGALVLTVVLAAITVAAQAATFSATIVDPLGARLAGVSVRLTNTQTRVVVAGRTAANGTISLPVAPGSYEFEASVPGFRQLRQRIDVTAGTPPQTFTLLVGELEETLQVVGTRGEPAGPPRVSDVRAAARQGFQQILAACGQAAAGDVPRGGRIRPPRKIRSVTPQYPQAALDAGIGGTVVLTAIIDAGGEIRDVRNANQATHPDLVAAGTDAVRDWAFDPTLLNCVPVEVEMRVTMQFDVR